MAIPVDIPEVQPTLQDSAGLRPTLSELRRKQMELNWSARGRCKIRWVSVTTRLSLFERSWPSSTKQIDAEAEHILGNMKNDYDIARAAGAIARGEPPEPHRESQFGNLRQVAATPTRGRLGSQSLRDLSRSVQRYRRAARNAGMQARGSFHQLLFRGRPVQIA